MPVWLFACYFTVVIAAGLLVAARRLTHYFQLESYQFYGYFKTVLRQWKKVLVPYALMSAFIVLLYFSLFICAEMDHGSAAANVIGHILMPLFPISWLGAGFLIRRFSMRTAEKKKFVMTGRMKRLYVVLGLVCLIVVGVMLQCKVFYLCVFLPVLLPLLVPLAAVIALPVEKFIFSLYYHDAEKRLLENDKLIRVGITGSYGKTSTKFVLDTLLSQKYNVLPTPASFNTPMGVTRVVRERLTPAHQVFIGEMGARHVGEIKELCGLVHPKIGILTAVGPQHLDTFKTIERIEKTKYELIEALPMDGLAVFLHDDGIVTKLYEKTQKPKLLIGKEGGDAWATDVQVSPNGSSFTLHVKGMEPFSCTTRLLGRHNISNILTAAAVAQYLGLTKEQIQRGISQLKPVEHRLQLLTSAGGVTVIDDAFNTNPRSSREALQVLSSFPGRRVIVTPGMVELGAEEEKYNYEFGQAMAACVDVAVLVGKKHTQPISRGLTDAGFPAKNIHVVSSLDEAIAFNRQQLRPGDVVMYENDLPDHYSEG